MVVLAIIFEWCRNGRSTVPVTLYSFLPDQKDKKKGQREKCRRVPGGIPRLPIVMMELLWYTDLCLLLKISISVKAVNNSQGHYSLNFKTKSFEPGRLLTSSFYIHPGICRRKNVASPGQEFRN